MNTNEVWNVLSNLKIGTVVAWISVICAIIAAICAAAKHIRGS